MEIDYVSHHLLFFASLVFGMSGGAFYDVLRLLRAFFKGRLFLFITDVMFCLYGSCLMCILFFNYSHGRIRAYAIFAFWIGAAAYYFTVGRLTKRIFIAVKTACVRFAGYTEQKIKAFCGKYYRRAYSYFEMRGLLAESSKGFVRK